MIKMQKSSVKTVSIIDTLSELAHNGGENVALAATQPKMTEGKGRTPQTPPQLKPRSPKVIVPVISSPNHRMTKLPPVAQNTSTGQFRPQVPPRSPMAKLTTSSPNTNNKSIQSAEILDLSAISTTSHLTNGSPSQQVVVRKKKKSGQRSKFVSATGQSRGQTPEWIREIFVHAKLGLVDRLVSPSDLFTPISLHHVENNFQT